MTSDPARTGGGLRLEPFRALHYSGTAGDLAEVTLAPPALWDFSALADLARSRDHHVLRLLSPSLTGGATAESTAKRWAATGALTVQTTPALYAWRWSQHGRSVVGVAGALRLPAAWVWPHEQVRPGLLAERASELGAGTVQPEPILLLYDGDRPLTPDGSSARGSSARGSSSRLVEPVRVDPVLVDPVLVDPVLVDLATADSHHAVSALTAADDIARVNGALAGTSLVVADGHHRFTVLSRLPAPRPRAFVLVVDVRRSELTVGPIPRVVPRLGWEPVVSTPGGRTIELVDDALDSFLAPADTNRLRWVVADQGRVVGLEMSTSRAAALGPGDAEPCGPIARDVCYLHERLLPSWGVRGDRVHYAHSWEAARTQAAATRGLAVASRATGLAEVMTAARGGLLLPHKATSIAPKPRAGLLMLGDGIAMR